MLENCGVLAVDPVPRGESWGGVRVLAEEGRREADSHRQDWRLPVDSGKHPAYLDVVTSRGEPKYVKSSFFKYLLFIRMFHKIINDILLVLCE
jgi:hypothetical protein